MKEETIDTPRTEDNAFGIWSPPDGDQMVVLMQFAKELELENIRLKRILLAAARYVPLSATRDFERPLMDEICEVLRKEDY